MKNKFFRKAVAVLLSIAMLVPMIPAAFAAQPSDFTDFPTGWSNEAMTAAVANGLLNGRTATTIEPQGNLTRAEMATIINRAFGAVKTADISQFHDVSASDWFYTEIAKAVNMQTFQGDGTGTMRPNSLITREEVFAVVARSLVLETSDFSALNNHPDGYNVADWAKPYASILSQKKYINGDSYGNLNPKSYITREEFAQIMHNIIKTYYTAPAMFNHSGASSSLIRTSGVILSDVTINGDLIIGDGVGAGTVVLKNVTIKGRLLARGGEGSVTLTNTTVGEGVVVKDVNGIVHFNNHRTEAPFVGIREITKATFIGETGSGTVTPGGGGGGGGGGGSKTEYKVYVKGAGHNLDLTIEKGKEYTLPAAKGGHSAFAYWKAGDKTYNAGDKITINSTYTFTAYYKYQIEHYFQKESDSSAYEIKSDKTETKYATLDASVSAAALTTGIDGFEFSDSHASNVKSGKVSANVVLTLKLYYNVKATTQMASYRVEHYYLPVGENAANRGDYVIDSTVTSDGRGEVGTEIAPAAVNKEGHYIYNDLFADKEPVKGIIKADNSLVIRFYYARKTYDTTYDLGQYVSLKTGISIPTGDLQYGKVIYLPSDDGVNVSGNRRLTHWIVEVVDEMGGIRNSFTVNKGSSFEIGAYVGADSDKYKIKPFTAAIGNGAYIVEHWFLKLGKDFNDYRFATDFEMNSSASGELVKDSVLTGDSAAASFEGFDYFGYRLSDPPAIQIEEGTTKTIKLYYNRLSYNVEFALGSDASYVDGYVPSDGSLQYGTTIKLPKTENVFKKSYRFTKWIIDGQEHDPGSDFTVGAKSYTITPNWYQLPSVSYKIKYMMAKLGKDITDKDNYKPNEDTTIPSSGSGLPDYDATAPQLIFYGFDEYLAFGEHTATIPEDNSLVLRRYYTRKTIATNIQTGGGTWRVDYTVPSSAQFGDTIELPDDGDITLDKKRLDGWYVTTVDANGNRTTVRYATGADLKIEVETIESIAPIWVDIDKVGYDITFWKLKVGGDSSKAEDYIEDTLLMDSAAAIPGTDVEAKYDDYSIYGFKPTTDAELLKAAKGKVPATGTLKLKLYFVRKDVKANYDVDLSSCSAADPDVFKSIDKEFGDKITLPEVGSIEKDGHRLVGWEVNNTTDGKFVTYNPGDDFEIITEGFVFDANANVLTIKPVWAKLYPYYIKHYIQQLDASGNATSNYTTDDTVQKNVILGYGIDGEKVKLPEAKITTIKGFKYNSAKSEINVEKSVTSDGNLCFDVYYDRLTINVVYYAGTGEKFIDGFDNAATVLFGAKVTLPKETVIDNPSKVFEGWLTNFALGGSEALDGNNPPYICEQDKEFVISDYALIDSKPTITFTAYYGDTLYTVQFMTGPSNRDIVHTVRVPEGSTVAQSVLDDLAAGKIPGYSGLLLDTDGYEENAYISPTLYGTSPYTHTVKYGWYYNPDLDAAYEKWTKFDNTIKITSELADDDGIVKIREKAPWITLKADISKFGTAVELSRPYEASEEILDAQGNVVTVGTRVLDTFKDYLWAGFEPVADADRTVLQKELQSNIEKAGNKVFGKLREKGILGANNEILDQSFTVKFASFIDRDLNKANIRKFIIDKAKETLESDTTLHEAIIDYFESIANSGDAEAIADLESLIEGTVKGALDDHNKETTDLVEEMCEKMLDDPSVVKTAIKEIYGIDVEVSDGDMQNNAKETIINWSESLLETDNSLLDTALQQVPYNKYTDGGVDKYHFTSANIGKFNTMDFFKTLMQKSDVTMESLKSNGITEAELADYIKPYVIKKVVNRLGNSSDATFFNKVISVAFDGTPFESYTRDEIVQMTTKELVKEAVSGYLKTKSIEEIADALGYTDPVTGAADLDALYLAQRDEIKDFVADKTMRDEVFFDSHIAPIVDVNNKTYVYNDFNKDLKAVIKMFITDKLSATSAAELANDDVIKDMLDDAEVIDAVLAELYSRLGTDDDFFDEMVDKQNFEISIDAASLNGKTVAAFLKDIVADKIYSITSADELAQLAGYLDWAEFVDDNAEDISEAVVSQISSDDTVYHKLVETLTGSPYEASKENEPKAVFGAVVDKLVADAIGGSDDEKAEARKQIEKLLKKQVGEQVSDSELSDIQNALATTERDDLLEEYLAIAVGKANATFADYANTRALISDVIKERLADAENLSDTIDQIGIDGADILGKAKDTAKSIINTKVDNLDNADNQAFVKDYLHDHAGIDYAGSIDASRDAREFIVDIVKSEIGTPSVIDDAFAQDFGYADLADMFADNTVRNIIETEAEKLVDTKDDFVKDQIESQLGLTYTGTLPATGLELVADYAKSQIDKINNVADLTTKLGYADQTAMFAEIKSVLADKVIDDIDGADGEAQLKKYVNQYTPNYDFNTVPSDSIAFIKEFVKGELDLMGWATIKSKLKDYGYTEDELDDLMDSELASMLENPEDDFIVKVVHALSKTQKYKAITADELKLDKSKDFVVAEAAEMLRSDNDFFEDVMMEMFGFVPDDIATESTNAFITDIIVDMFETTDEEHIAKRDKMIHFATVEIVEHNQINMLDDYVDYAIEHLDSLPGEKGGTTRLDETIDEIIASKYEDTVNKLVDQLVDGEQFTIEPDVKFVLEAIYGMIDDYSYDAIKAQIEQLIADKGAPEGLLEKVFKIYPESTLRAIYDKPYNEVVAQIEQGLIDNSNGNAALVSTGMTFVINPVAHIYAPLYDTNFHRFTDKAEKLFFYRDNQYLRELASMTSPATFFDGSESEGYRLKSYRDYYDLMLKFAIIGDDAINWYTEQLTAKELDELVLNYEDFFVEKANMLADMLSEYADTGDIPNKLDNNVVRTIEKALREKFASQLDGVLEWYKTSPINKEYGSGDYEYIRKAVNKAFRAPDITTDEVFDLMVKLYDTAAGKYDSIGGIHDKIEKIDADTYEVTIKGRTFTVNRISEDEFEASLMGKSFTVRRHNGENPDDQTYSEVYEVSFEGNTVEISRAIRG